ncbi:hypothetical protein [Vibrio rumoiensis]|uniref:hypothetical protein n=1 Tax=Vibrio rumoiensis TaxID=76258 RepID=UPI003AA7C452
MKKRFFIVLFCGLFAFSLPTYSASQPVVKKSKNNICHDKNSRSYKRTKNYTPYPTLKACLNSGGRLPKK